METKSICEVLYLTWSYPLKKDLKRWTRSQVLSVKICTRSKQRSWGKLSSPLVVLNRPFGTKSAMLEGKLIIISPLGRWNKETSIRQTWLAFVLMSQCGNDNELALQHGRFCTMWSFVAKGLLVISESLVPLFQSESKSETIVMKMTFIYMKLNLQSELIFIWMISRLDSFSNDKETLNIHCLKQIVNINTYFKVHMTWKIFFC